MCNPVITETVCGVPLESFKMSASPAEIANLFCKLNDEQQAEFFTAVKKIADGWDGGTGMQFWSAGGHMAECPGAQDNDAIVIAQDIVSGYNSRQKRLRAAEGLPSMPVSVFAG